MNNTVIMFIVFCFIISPSPGVFAGEEQVNAPEKTQEAPETPPFLYKAGVSGFLRPEAAGNLNLVDNSYSPQHGAGRFVYRVKPYVYWHPTDWLDIHVEGQGYGYTGGQGQEFSRYSLYQGFIEARLPERDWLALKGGRQEFSYGSTYILGTNSPYDGLVYDALRLRMRPTSSVVVDILGGNYASPYDTGLKGDLAGIYSTWNISEGNAVEGYYLRDGGAFKRHGGERLDIFGFRGTARFGALSLELEPVYESGRHFNGGTGMNDGINAFGGHIDLTYDVMLGGCKNKFIAGYAYGSGSRSSVNGVDSGREFRNQNNDSSIFGDIGIMVDQSGVTVNGHHASGLTVYTLGWGVDITREINVSASGHYNYANYVEPGFSRNIGLETDLTLTWNIMEGLSVISGYDHFFTGGFFKGASGRSRDVDYGYLMVQFDFSKSKPRLKPVKG